MLKFLVIGRSGSGKDALRRELEQRGFSFVKSATTRSKRSEDEDTHLFVDIDEMEVLLEDAIAKTEIDGAIYCATNQMFEDCDAYIIDPTGALELWETKPEHCYRIIYIDAKHDDRLAAAVGRADDKVLAHDIFESRHAAEDEQFSDFENLIRNHPEDLPGCVTAYDIFENDFTRASLEEEADNLLVDKTLHYNMANLLDFAMEKGIVGDDENVPLCIVDKDGNALSSTFIAEHLITNQEVSMHFFRTLLSLVPLPSLTE